MKKTLLLLALTSGLFAEISVIVNPSVGVDSLTSSQVKNIFLVKAKSFPNGKSAIVVDQATSQPIYELFYKAVAHKDSVKMNKYWVKLTFTGRGEAPKKVDADIDVITLVKNNQNIIGYVNSSAVTDGVKVVFKVP